MTDIIRTFWPIILGFVGFLVRLIRLEVRDIPQQPGFPDNVTWPTAP